MLLRATGGLAACLATHAWASVTVSLTVPTNDSVHQAGVNITLSATAIASKGYTLSKVEFYQGTTLIGGNTSAPYSIVWNSVPAGNYSLTAKAFATKKNKPDQTASSAVVNITVNASAVALHFIHVDHLNTPRLVANQSGQTVWRWDQQEPFAVNVPDENPLGLGTFEFPLRFPGQYFDKESNLSYNYFRDYDSSVARYVESDPIGLRAGLNTYAYAGSAPLSAADFFGLDTLTCIKPLNLFGGFSSGTSKSFDGYIPNSVNPLYHQYLCVAKDGELRCGGQDTTGGPVASGASSQDFYPYNRPDLCVKVDDNKCVENCVYRKISDPERPSYILFFSDCQRWVQKVLRDCRQECAKGK